jgi:putative ABC transport system permease protein
MDRLALTFRHAVRSLLRFRTLSALAILCMGLGIGTCVWLFTGINPWLWRPLPYPAGNRLVSLRETLPDGGGQWSGRTLLSADNYLDWRARARSFDDMGAFDRTSYNLGFEGEPERVPAARITASVFPTLGMGPVVGRLFSADEDRPGSAVALIGNSIWERRFGRDPAVVGRAIRLDGRRHTILGVMPESFAFPEYAQVWTPLGIEVGAEPRDNRHLDVVARLRPATALATAQAEARAIAAQTAREHPDSNGGRSAIVQGYVDGMTPPGVRIGLYLVLAAALFVQLIASANVANLLLVKAAGQRHDAALRVALGARRRDVLCQSLAEALILVGGGGALGLLIGWFGASRLAFGAAVDPPFWARVTFDWRVVAFAVAVTAASALLVSLVPALQGGRVPLVDELKDSARTTAGGRRGRLGRLLAASEMAAALVLLIGAALMVQSFERRCATDAGVDSRGALTARLALAGDAYRDASRRALFLEELVRRLAARTDVVEAGAANFLPFGDADSRLWPTDYEVEGQPIEAHRAPRAVAFTATRGFTTAAGVAVGAGRGLTPEEEAEGREVALVSEGLARRHWGTADPIGRRLRVGKGPWLRVVGVTRDIRPVGDMLLTENEEAAQIFVPYRLVAPAEVVLAVRTRSDPLLFGGALRATVRSLDPALPLTSVFTLDEVRVRSAWVARLWGQMLSDVAGLALILAVLGVYGVVSYSVSQRTHEIGIRMAVGASRGRVLRLVLGDGVRLALQAATLGVLGALAMTRSLARLLYGVGALDPATLVGCTAALVLVAVFASVAPAWRGTRVDPVVALRSE